MTNEEIALGIISVLVSGWNHADGAEYASPFADSVVYVDVRGVLHLNISREEVGSEHQMLFEGPYKDGVLTMSLVQALQIDEQTILASTRNTLDVPAGPAAGIAHTTASIVISGRGGKWQAIAFHNTPVAPRRGE